ncbi:MAG: PIG-L deacetylase family protein [Terriglobales bacterium]
MLAAHPDDEAVGAAGWLAEHRGRLAVVFLTDGVPQQAACMAPGFSDRQVYKAVRRSEARAACATLCPAAGLYFAPFGDQILHRSLAAASRWLEDTLRKVAPEALLCPAFEAGHPDHDAASLLGSLAAARWGVPAWEYALYTVWDGQLLRQQFPGSDGFRRQLPRPLARRKRAALALYRSQQRTLAEFDAAVEAIRPMPDHDYTRPARGEAVYERWGWPIRSAEVSAALRHHLAACLVCAS